MSQATLDLILTELKSFRNEVNEEFHAVRQEIQDVRSELRQEIQDVRSELRQEIQDVRSELHVEIRNVQTELQSVSKEQQVILNRLNSQENQVAQLYGMVKSIRQSVADIGERMDASDSMLSHRQVMYAASIDILNREQLAMKTDIEMLKSR